METVTIEEFNNRLNVLLRRKYIETDERAILIDGVKFKPSELSIKATKIDLLNPIKSKPIKGMDGRREQDEAQVKEEKVEEVKTKPKVDIYLNGAIKVYRYVKDRVKILEGETTDDKIYVLDGNVFGAEPHFPIMHSIGADYTFGAGFAKTIDVKYNIRKMFLEAKLALNVGDIVIAKCKERVIINIVSKPRSKDKPNGTAGFKKAVLTLGYALQNEKIHKVIGPLLETGLNGLKLSEVREILNNGLREILNDGLTVALYQREEDYTPVVGYNYMRDEDGYLADIKGITSEKDYILYQNNQCYDCRQELSKLKFKKSDKAALFKPKTLIDGRLNTKLCIGACDTCLSLLELEGPMKDIYVNYNGKDDSIIEDDEEIVINCTEAGMQMVINYFKEKIFTRLNALRIGSNVPEPVVNYLSRFVYQVVQEEKDVSDFVENGQMLEYEEEDEEEMSPQKTFSLEVETDLVDETDDFLNENQGEKKVSSKKPNEQRRGFTTKEKTDVDKDDSDQFVEKRETRSVSESVPENNDINTNETDIKNVNIPPEPHPKKDYYVIVYPDIDQINLQKTELENQVNGFVYFTIASGTLAGGKYAYAKFLANEKIYIPLTPPSGEPEKNEIVAGAFQLTIADSQVIDKEVLISLFLKALTLSIAEKSLNDGHKYIIKTYFNHADNRYWIHRYDY